MKLTLKDGTVFEGSVTEYVEFLFEAQQLAEEETLIKAVEDEDAKSEPAPPYQPKVGDIVKVVSNSTFSNNNVGDIGKVAKLGSSVTGRFTVEVPNGATDSIWTEPQDVRKALEDEIAQYEQAVKDAEIAEKWAKLGRKVNEYKVGDIIEIKTYECGDSEGTIAKVLEIVDEDSLRYHSVNSCNGKYRAGYRAIQLVAPVEATI